jgi:4,5:9,10-diseco-3-hydroxy-5,9,17-trioxoandrosta-1(10),2-diene-4-oate hydrolase
VILNERYIDVGGLPTRCLTAGTTGPPLVLLHGVGDNALNWSWVLPALASTHQVYAPDLPGSSGSSNPTPDYSPAFFTRFLVAFLNAVGINSAAVIGHSLGGLVSLRLALSEPERVTSLGLVASAGLGRGITYALRLPTLPGCGEAAVAWGNTPLGAAQRAWSRVPLLFGRPERVPAEWITEQTRIAQLPGFLQAQVAILRAQVGFGGQRQVLVDRLADLEMPTIIVWGTRDRVLPYSQAKEAVTRLQEGALELFPDCGHLPHVEQPDRFAAILSRFLNGQASH